MFNCKSYKLNESLEVIFSRSKIENGIENGIANGIENLPSFTQTQKFKTLNQV